MSTPSLAGLGEGIAPARRRIPFDSAFRYDLTGEPNRVHRQTVTVSVEASFVAVSIGYGVVPEVSAIRFGPAVPPPIVTIAAAAKTPVRAVDFAQVIDGLAASLGESFAGGLVGPRTFAVLTNGFRIDRSRFAIAADGSAALDADSLDELFEAVAAPADQIQFKYALFDDASGREFQSEPILNIAGLGISNGDRPFRYLATPIVFGPQSRIRMEVTELSSFRGELHVSLQGYKVLGGAGTPTARTRGFTAGGAR
jgi:hypothetical protein